MDALQLTQELVGFESTSCLTNVPVTDHAEQRLRESGFTTERIDYTDPAGVPKSCVVGKKGPGSGGVAYFGHLDVVPADDWSRNDHGPFTPCVDGDRLYGRGSCDMKGSVACMLAAAAKIPDTELARPIYITCTADEEVGYGGAHEVANRSQMFAEMVAGESRGIIGEPTRMKVVHGHKGTYGMVATSRGRAAHSSTREGLNANLAMIPYLYEIKELFEETETEERWQNSEFDPPTVTWNIGINDHTAAINITPPQSICTIYFRPMPGIDPDELVERSRKCAERHGLDFEVPRVAPPLYIDPQSPYVQEMLQLTGCQQSTTVSYGTDGCMFSDMKYLIVLGPGDIAQAHTADEWIDLEQIEQGTRIYEKLIRHWCC